MLTTVPAPMPSAVAPMPCDDYDVVRRAIAFISEQWRAQPGIETIAEEVGVTPTELHSLFRRWAGLTPKAFLQAVTMDRARGLVRDAGNVLDAAYDLGLSGPGRLHDLFVAVDRPGVGDCCEQCLRRP